MIALGHLVYIIIRHVFWSVLCSIEPKEIEEETMSADVHEPSRSSSSQGDGAKVMQNSCMYNGIDESQVDQMQHASQVEQQLQSIRYEHQSGAPHVEEDWDEDAILENGTGAFKHPQMSQEIGDQDWDEDDMTFEYSYFEPEPKEKFIFNEDGTVQQKIDCKFRAGLERVEQENKQTGCDLDTDDSGSHTDTSESETSHIHRSKSYSEWLDEIESLFSSEVTDTLPALLRKAFSESDNPFALVIHIVTHGFFDFYSNEKNSLATQTLKEFESWLKMKIGGKNVDECKILGLWPTEDQKDAILDLVVKRTALLDLVKISFMLTSCDTSCLERHIRMLLLKKKYREAAIFAYKLDFQKHFETEEILLPLIIQDKLQLAESYVEGCPTIQEEFVNMLEDLCSLEQEQLDQLPRDLGMPRNNRHILNNNKLSKLAERMIKKFKLDPEDYHHVFKGKNLSGLKYLLQQKYSETGSSRKWNDMIERAVGNKTWLQEELVNYMAQIGDIDEALRWAQFYGVPENLLPEKLKTKLKSRNNSSSSLSSYTSQSATNLGEDWESELSDDNWGNKQQRQQHEVRQSVWLEDQAQVYTRQYHELRLPKGRIFLVDDAVGLRRCKTVLCKAGNIVGMDTEWKASLCRAGTDTKLAVMQLAVLHSVFILDLVILQQFVSEEELADFIHSLMTNPSIIKLGYGVESDFKAIIATCPSSVESMKKVQSFVDLSPLSKQILILPGVSKKLQKDESFFEEIEKGLSQLVRQCLGRPLDKTYQVSDWEKRPLLREQIIYAALDAYCLLEVYEVLSQWVRESGRAGQSVNMKSCLIPMKWLNPEAAKAAKLASQKHKHPKHGYHDYLLSCKFDSVDDFKSKTRTNALTGEVQVVCDTMLQGLGRHLRSCGVDVAILSGNDQHTKTVEIAQREDRIILTSGTPYYSLKSQVPPGRCMSVPPGNSQQQVASVMNYLNVKVTIKDIFSRCQLCNGNSYIKVTPQQIFPAIKIRQENQQGPPPYHIRHLQRQGLCPENSPINYEQLTIADDVTLKVESVPLAMLEIVNLFYCCATCGKIFWEGKHFSQVAAQFGACFV